MKLRPLIENPLRNYAVFSGRAGRAEFWLFVLTFIVITQLAWLLGFGVMKIAGVDRDHDGTSPDQMMQQSEYGTSEDGVANTTSDDRSSDEGSSDDRPKVYQDQNGHGDDMLNFLVHRHGTDGYHLHGIMRDDHMSEYDREGLDDDNDHGRYEHPGYHRDGRPYMLRFHKSRAERGGDILWMISVAALLLPLLAVGARRLHDSNHSGWWQLLALIPAAGWLVLAIFFLLPGEEEGNRFGGPPTI